MSHVAVVTCAGENVDPDSPLLLRALEDCGLEASLCIWDDPTITWSNFDLVVVRSTWDYAARRDKFLRWARDREQLVNPYEVIEYSSDKHYLADLARRGHRVIPSQFCDVGDTPIFPDDQVVVKPCVGAGSMDVERYRADEQERARAHVLALHARDRDVLIQPYLESVDTVGERALIFIDGLFSHAMTKGAMLNVQALDRNALYRREQMSRAQPEPEALEVAKALLHEGGFGDLLYARVDLVFTDDGWALMELELVEPSLYLSFDEHAARRLSEGIVRRLA